MEGGGRQGRWLGFRSGGWGLGVRGSGGTGHLCRV